MAKAKNGDVVKVHYTGTFDDGEKFDSSIGRTPLKFTLGEHMVIPGFEEAIVGMEVGEKKKVHLEVDKAYGPTNPQLIFKLPRNQFPEGTDPRVGEVYELKKDDLVFRGVIIEVDDENITFDGNHPMAGKALNFEIELVEIEASA